MTWFYEDVNVCLLSHIVYRV